MQEQSIFPMVYVNFVLTILSLSYICAVIVWRKMMSVTLRALRVKDYKNLNHFPWSKCHDRSATKLSKRVGLLANKTVDESDLAPNQAILRIFDGICGTSMGKLQKTQRHKNPRKSGFETPAILVT